jgi:hypothetical protein
MNLAGLTKARRNAEDERSQMGASQIVPERRGATMPHGDVFLSWRRVVMVAAAVVENLR